MSDAASEREKARLTPLPREEWAPELLAFITEFQASVRGERPAGGRPGGANLLGTLARYPALCTTFLAFNGHLLYGATLAARHRELLILRVASLRNCDYEWAQHTLLAGDAGLRPEEIARVTAGPDSPGWTPLERALLKAADELIADGAVTTGTWNVLARDLDDQRLMDVVFTVGTYDLVAMALRSFAVEPEPDLVPHLPA
jgi:AhpD family alkylhydroperoxidase